MNPHIKILIQKIFRTGNYTEIYTQAYKTSVDLSTKRVQFYTNVHNLDFCKVKQGAAAQVSINRRID